jgi:CTP synthase
MAKLRVLFIDDDKRSVDPAMKWVMESGYACKFAEFHEFNAIVEDYQPHIVILDRLEGSPPAVDQGTPIFEGIWNLRFCPVVIYSAFPHDEEDPRMAHPMVRNVQKGMDLEEFRTAVAELSQHADALETAEQHVRSQFAVALRDVAPYAADTFADLKERKEAIVRYGRRRLAALMDEITMMGKLASWEQYIFPPVSRSLMLGDIIRLRDGNHNDATTFRIILTPSCDMVSGEGRQPKVKFVLVAICCTPRQGIQGTSLCRISGNKEKLKDALIPSLLSQGYLQRMVPFPALRDKVPTMMADMKDLELIPIADIDAAEPGTSKYFRVAGLDSPFREEISWAYMQNACRPGMPERELEPWRNEIMDSCGA